VLPCHAARSLPLSFDSARSAPLARAWNESAGMRAFRGNAWMPEPCRSCARRDADFGGCRCQAFALTHDLRATDPACALAPQHALVRSARERAEDAGRERRWIYRGR
jgi:pyrroloquinoline quinone biosynthesis protein E